MQKPVELLKRFFNDPSPLKGKSARYRTSKLFDDDGVSIPGGMWIWRRQCGAARSVGATNIDIFAPYANAPWWRDLKERFLPQKGKVFGKLRVGYVEDHV